MRKCVVCTPDSAYGVAPGGEALELMRITDQLWLVPAMNSGRFPFAQSVYVDAERKLLFDAGLGPQLMGQFVREFPVDIVIVSHSHPDHIAGCWMLADTAPVFVPAEAAASFGRLDLLADRFVEGEEEQTLWKALVTKVMGYRDCQFSRTYDAKSAFDLGSVKLVALYTPGHVLDHYCFYEANSGVMMLFDIDLSPLGPWYGHRESDLGSFEASIEFVRSFSPEVVVSSHMGVLRQGVDEALADFGARFGRRDDLILELVREPHTLDELAAGFPLSKGFHPKLKPLALYWEKQMIHKHLDRLVENGLAVPNGDRFVRR